MVRADDAGDRALLNEFEPSQQARRRTQRQFPAFEVDSESSGKDALLRGAGQHLSVGSQQKIARPRLLPRQAVFRPGPSESASFAEPIHVKADQRGPIHVQAAASFA